MSIIELQQILIGLSLLLVIPPLAAHFVPARAKSEVLPSDETPKRIPFFDVIRGVAIVAVVLIHITYLFPELSGVSERTLAVMNNLLRFTIPVFILTSGMLLAPPQSTWWWFGEFIRRRFVAIGIPYILVVGIIALEQGYSLTTFVSKVVSGTAEVPFYFIIALFQLYLLYPLLYRIALYRVGVWLTLVFSFVTVTLPFPAYLHPFVHFFPLVFFFVWGIYLRAHMLTTSYRPVLWPWALLCVVYLATTIFFEPARFYNTQFTYGPAFFVLAYWLYTLTAYRLGRIYAGIAYLGSISLWIFLTHFAVLRYLFAWWVDVRPMFTELDLLALSVIGVVASIGVAVLSQFLYESVARLITGSTRTTKTSSAQ